MDTATISEEIRAAMRTKVRTERRELLVGWIHEISYAHDEATITLRVPLKPVANWRRARCAFSSSRLLTGNEECDVDSFILLKIKRRIA
jgi:hypothetical protein